MPKPYEGIGYFEHHWRSPPPPFNPDFDPGACARSARVTASMKADGYYANHTREECRDERRRRYDADVEAGGTQDAPARPHP